MRSLPALLALFLLPFLAVGCSRAIVVADNPTTINASEYRDTYEAATTILREYGFVIDRRDYRFGRITTLPQGSPNLFEIWNPQNTTADQALESTLASEQRRVNILIDQTDPLASPDHADTDYTLEVEVLLERKQIATRRLAGSARRNIFSNLAALPQELAKRGITASYFQPVGRDPYLEARLIQEITERAKHID